MDCYFPENTFLLIRIILTTSSMYIMHSDRHYSFFYFPPIPINPLSFLKVLSPHSCFFGLVCDPFNLIVLGYRTRAWQVYPWTSN